MFIGFACSRAMMSIGMIGLLLNSLWPHQLNQTWQLFRSNLFAQLSVVYFLIYLLSGFYSSNSQYWTESVVNKLPFLFFPFAMLATPFQLPRFKEYTLLIINLSLLGIIIYSLNMILVDWEAYRDAYSYSHPIPTNSENDHIRVSLALSLTILLNFSFLRSNITSKVWKIFGYSGIAVFIIYIHILSAKSGLLALYITMLCIIVWYFKRRKKLVLSLILGPFAVLIIGITMYSFVGTFRHKMQYMVTEYNQYKTDGRFDYNYSDNGRLITYDIAWLQIKRHPLVGVGTGDTRDIMRQGYDELYPEVPQDLRFIPINQILYDALAFGVFIALFVIFFICSPLLAKDIVAKPYLIISSIVLIAALMVESMLQVQYGVFIYLFFTMIWYKWQQPYSVE